MDYTNKLSRAAETLIHSEIRRISGIVDQRKQQGEEIYNLTIGDFSPVVFQIPTGLKQEIINAYNKNLTNYPEALGMKIARESISKFLNRKGGFEYLPDEIIIGSGTRPLTYTVFKIIVDPGDVVIYPAPSWNNNCYVGLFAAKGIPIITKPENNFLVTATELKPYINDTTLIALNSPLNPSGTLFSKNQLTEILDLVIEENKRRIAEKRKLVYIFFDQVYWLLTFNNSIYYNPVLLRPEIRDYIIFTDGISKCFAATGVRLGWAFGPKSLINKMSSVLAHIGAWSPKPEQVALGKFLNNDSEVDQFLNSFRDAIFNRLHIFYNALLFLKESGLPIDVIPPQGAMYLTINFDLTGKKTPSGKVLETTDDILNFILDDAKVALVPFYAFGAPKSSRWFRLSVGTCTEQDAHKAAQSLITSIKKLK
ncbi:MAG: pyridoxal phosphate-dependent aminotransferase [Ignavibacteria bacterium]